MEIALMRYFGYTKNIIVPNIQGAYSIPIKFETDILSISKSGYATGVEIKVSKSDLKADLKKRHQQDFDSLCIYDYNKTNKEFYYGCFKNFYYAVPEYLKNDCLEQIPNWMGLLVARRNKDLKRISIIEVRPPKILYKRKWTELEMLKIARLGSIRIYKYKNSILKEMTT